VCWEYLFGCGGFAQPVVKTSLTLRVSVIFPDISHEILTRSVSEVFHWAKPGAGVVALFVFGQRECISFQTHDRDSAA
jgi:hypothetical protein